MNFMSVFLLVWFYSIMAEETSVDTVEDALVEFKAEDIRFLLWHKTNHTDYITIQYNKKGTIKEGIKSSGFDSSLNTIGTFCFELAIYLIQIMSKEIISLQLSLMAGQ